MTVNIRNVHVQEFEDFMRYLERAFGHSKRFFERFGPHIYQPTEQACSWGYVVEQDGKIVSHVGLYPIETVTAGIPLRIGGIGGVSTAASARGKGYMTKLLYHVIDEMRRLAYPVSWLGGDRQRYNTFGWEWASPVYYLEFSRRSLDRAGVTAVAIEEVLPEEALAAVRQFQTLSACHTHRPYLEAQLNRFDMRLWVTEDGYVILSGQGRHHIRIIELVSASGNEVGIIKALLDWNFGDQATWELSMWDEARLGRVMPCTSYWRAGSSGMYRINDLTQLLNLVKSFLAHRAMAVRDFSVAVGIKAYDRTPITTITLQNGMLTIVPGKQCETYVELSPIAAARVFLGGPAIHNEEQLPPGLLALLPIPVYVLPLDHV